MSMVLPNLINLKVRSYEGLANCVQYDIDIYFIIFGLQSLSI